MISRIRVNLKKESVYRMSVLNNVNWKTIRGNCQLQGFEQFRARHL